MPFWGTVQREGRVDGGANSIIGVGGYLTQGSSPVSVSAGVDVVGRTSSDATLYAHEMYGRLHAGPVELTAGRAAYRQGIVDTSFSIGGTVRSPNTTPIPALRLDVPQYLSVPFTHDMIAVRGAFEHGWLESDRFVQNAYLHAKEAYLRIFPTRWPVQLHAGVTHNVMWGGTHPELGNLADGPNAFWSVVTARPLADDSVFTGENEDSAVGNTVAAYNTAAAVRLFGIKTLAYREFYIETAGGRELRNVWDGLWGIRIALPSRPRFLDHLLYEHVRFVRQNARRDADGQAGQSGRADYYNNFLYRSGWTYHGRVLGTPLALTGEQAPRLDGGENGQPIVGNILVAHHVGIGGRLASSWRYRSLLTISRNRGTIFNPQPERHQFMGLIEVRGLLSKRYNLSGRVSLTADIGSIFEDRLGTQVGLTWKPSLSK